MMLAIIPRSTIVTLLQKGSVVMTLKGWAAVAAVALLMPCAGYAATEANFGAQTTGDLVELCAATPDNAIGTAAVNFCEGFAQGAVLVEMQNIAAFRGAKLFCMPNPPPSRNEAVSEFVNWARMSPDRMSASSTDGLFRFLSERYPCPQSR
jgi:Rap1a immunity proteins